jgi:hypothetical protein
MHQIKMFAVRIFYVTFKYILIIIRSFIIVPNYEELYESSASDFSQKM